VDGWEREIALIVVSEIPGAPQIRLYVRKPNTAQVHNQPKNLNFLFLLAVYLSILYCSHSNFRSAGPWGPDSAIKPVSSVAQISLLFFVFFYCFFFFFFFFCLLFCFFLVVFFFFLPDPSCRVSSLKSRTTGAATCFLPRTALDTGRAHNIEPRRRWMTGNWQLLNT